MRPITLELHCPKDIDGVTADPKPNWSLDGLLSELKSLELKLNGSPVAPVVHFTKQQLREFPNMKSVNRSCKPFVMRVTDNDMENTGCDEDDIQDEIFSNQNHLPILPLHSCVKDEIRNILSVLETNVRNENERLTSAFIQVEKYAEARRELDRKLDLQYRQKIAEALENHLLALRLDFDYRSRKEERIYEKALKEAKRKEKALQEEKVRQEKAKAEVETAKKRAEEAALEAERRGAKEAAEKEKATTRRVSGQVALKLHIDLNVEPREESLNEVKDRGEPKEWGFNKVQSAGIMVKATESALRIEAESLQKLKEIDEKNHALRLSSNKDFSSYELQIARLIKQNPRGRESVKACASELIKTINDPLCPQSISVATFAKKIVSQSATVGPNNNSTAFACGHLIVIVTSQVPLALDLLLAEFHKAFIYTVPKHLVYSESAFSKVVYYKMMGYRVEDGRIEDDKSFLERIQTYMRLYGSLVQTEVDGVDNRHGLKEGWAWLARFLKALPANIYTAVALQSFLRMAGFALFRKYKSQFRKILNFISHNFMDALQQQAENDPELNRVMVHIKSYIDNKEFLNEPIDWRMEDIVLKGSA